MKARILALMFVTFVATSSEMALAKSIYFGSSIELVPVNYGAKTILRFDEPVKTISNVTDFVIKPVNEDAPDYAILSVEPRHLGGKTDVSFILANGEIAKLRLSVVPRQASVKVESIYDIKSQRSMIENRAAATPFLGRLDLMTAMIRGDQVVGFEITAPNIDVGNDSNGVKVTLRKVYSGDAFKGYVYEIASRADAGHINLDVRSIQFGSPNQALLAYSDLETLDPKDTERSKSRLIVITKQGVNFRDALLPIRVTKEAKKDGDTHE